jgi:hypothetical protein
MMRDKIYITVEFMNSDSLADSKNGINNNFEKIIELVSFGYFPAQNQSTTSGKSPFYVSDWVVSRDQQVQEFVNLLNREILPRLIEKGYKIMNVNSIDVFTPFTDTPRRINFNETFMHQGVTNGHKIRIA